MDINGSVAFVTGGARGLGRAIVSELLQRGASRVYASSREEFSHPDSRVVPLKLNVTDDDAVRRIAQTLPDVTLVINNAGLATGTQAFGSDLTDLTAELHTNLFGLLHVVNAFAPTLAANGGGAILNVLSVRAWATNGSSYSISKAAAWSATNSVRLSLAAQGTTVTGLHVGLMDTDMVRHVEAEKMAPEDVAAIALDAVEAGQIEVLADETSRWAKERLSGPLESLFPSLRR